MSVVRIATNFNIDIEFESPAFHRRLLAWIIDMVVQILYLLLAMKLLAIISNNMDMSISSGYNRQALGTLFLVPFFTYHLVCELAMQGQSLGKKILGIRVISENGGRPSIGQYVIRWLIRTSDVFLLIMLLLLPVASQLGSQLYFAFAGGALLFLTDIILVNTNRQQRLGDILAHTLLINTKQKESINDTIFLNISNEYLPSFPQVMQLSDRDINSLKSILDTARRRHDFNLAEMASYKIKGHLKIDSTLSPFDFLEVLLKDYNYLSAN